MQSRGSGAFVAFMTLGGVLFLAGLVIIFITHLALLGAVLALVGVLALAIGLRTRRTAPTVTVVPAPTREPVAAPITVTVAPPPAPPELVVVAPPAPPVPPAAPVILPVPGPLFIGREQELEDLVARLRRSRGPGAIGIVGPAGVGKTTLIGQAVERHRAEGTFADGFSWHACTDYHGDVGLRRLLIDVLDRFGGPQVAMTSTLRMGEAAVADLIRGQRILFWLDDVPADFPLGRALTTLTTRGSDGNGPTLIVASRTDWDMPEVGELVLEPPSLDEALDHLRSWMDLAGRTTEREDYDALKAICVNLSSLPLALRLAAGFGALNGTKLTKLAADLGSVVFPPGDLLQTAERTIAFVEQALFPQPRQIFATLGIFDGPLIDLDDAMAVAVAATGTTAEGAQGDLGAMGLLGLLEGDGSEARPQLRLHPLVRNYARACFAGLSATQVARARAAWSSIVAARRAEHDDMATSLAS